MNGFLHIQVCVLLYITKKNIIFVMIWRKLTTKEIDAMEHQAVQTLLAKGYSVEDIELMKINIHAMVAPIIRYQFKKFYEDMTIYFSIISW